MHIELKNIGMIKETKVNLDGLTVIAGENDTGKSTVGKTIMALIKADNVARNKSRLKQSKNFYTNREHNFNKQIDLLFDNQISKDGKIILYNDTKIIYEVYIKHNNCDKFNGIDEKERRDFLDCTFIQTPLVWDLYNFFVSIATIRTENDIYGYRNNIDYPYILWDLFSKLAKKRIDCNRKISFINEIKSLIKGEFIKDKLGRFYYSKNNNGIGETISLNNTAMGIKLFGILQVLLENCYITPYGFFIIDEPENHLHPKWQLEMAKILVSLAKEGIKIVVNSHSPYMIEALKRYSELKKIENKTSFYLAEEGYIKYQDSLENIFEKLAIPMRELKKLKMQRYLND